VKLQIGVMGSSGGIFTDAELELARRQTGGESLGISPAHSREEHIELYESPTEPYTAIAFAGCGLMGREVENIHSSDFVVFIAGRSGTMGEFCIAYDEGKLIGVLRNSGGLANHFAEVAALFKKETGAVIIQDDDPEHLIDRCLEICGDGRRPSAVVFENVPRG
jgi:predicted Rossmann-fold nucleotide-binding protein